MKADAALGSRSACPARAGSRLRAWQVAALALLVAALCALPFMVSGYRVFQLTMVAVYSIAILGLNLLTGYSGQLSLGHGAFYALGAYSAAILMDRYGVPYWATPAVAGGVCLFAGTLFGQPARRLQAHYLGLATFALAVATPQLLKYKGIEAWTGGVQGIVLLKPDAPAWFPVTPDQWLYLFTLAIAIALFLAAWNLLRGGVGRALVAIRDHPIAATAMGIDVPRYKAILFGVSAMYAGVAGALGAITVQFVGPDSFQIGLSISLLVGVVVGGLASISGAVYGALFIQFIPNVADQWSKSAPWAVFGLFLIGFMYAMPYGVAGFIRNVRARLRLVGRGFPPERNG